MLAPSEFLLANAAGAAAHAYLTALGYTVGTIIEISETESPDGDMIYSEMDVSLNGGAPVRIWAGVDDFIIAVDEMTDHATLHDLHLALSDVLAG